MNVSAWSIRNPVPAVLVFILLTVLGLIGFQRLDVQDFPDMDLPTIKIAATLEGAAPTQLETEVARKIEDKLASLTRLDHITTTITDGAVNINVTFELDKDGEEALSEVRNAVDGARAEMPASMNSPTVSKLTSASSALLTYTVESSRLDEQDLSWFVDNDVTKALLSVKGVASVGRVGGIDREVRVELVPALMAGLGVTPSDVSRQLKAVQQENSGGEGRVGGLRQSSRTIATVGSAQEIAALAVPLSDGRYVRLDQIARISDSHAERTTLAFRDGKPVIGFQVTRSRGYSDVGVAQGVRGAVERFSKAHPEVAIAEASTTVTPIEDNYRGSMHLLYEGALLAVIVVWWFLRDWRATLVAATALPLSIIPAFGFMALAGYSLNTITLLALSLVVGILVDDAIVEIENIERHKLMGKTPYQAAMEAADEIGLAVIATTFSLVAVFLPTAFMGGVSGLVFSQFGITTSVAVLSTSFMPAQDDAQTNVTLTLPPGSTLEDTAAMSARAAQMLRTLPEVKSVFVSAGTVSSGGGFAVTTNANVTGATLTVDLVARGDRKLKQSGVEAKIRELLRALPGTRISVGGGGTGQTMQITLASDNPQALSAAVAQAEEQLRTLQRIGTVTSSAALQRPEIQVRPDAALAAARGVTSESLADAVRLATYGDYSTSLPKLNLPERQIPIRVRMDPAIRDDLDSVAQLRVLGRQGTVSLGSVAAIGMGSGPSQIDRIDRLRNVTLDVELNGRPIGEVQREAMALPALASLPAGVQRVEQGELEQMAELFSGFGIAMAIGIFCVYAVLVLLFHDFLQPATILCALPLAFGGALVALIMTNQAFSMPVVIGVLMLMGIVTKNSILLVDYAILARRDHSMGRLEAVIDGCHKRARPIVMTTLAMGAGMLPNALGLGTEPSFRQPMAIVVIGGLITSTVLSLLVVPVVFTYVDDVLEVVRRWLRARTRHQGVAAAAE